MVSNDRRGRVKEKERVNSYGINAYSNNCAKKGGKWNIERERDKWKEFLWVGRRGGGEGNTYKSSREKKLDKKFKKRKIKYKERKKTSSSNLTHKMAQADRKAVIKNADMAEEMS